MFINVINIFQCLLKKTIILVFLYLYSLEDKFALLKKNVSLYLSIYSHDFN